MHEIDGWSADGSPWPDMTSERYAELCSNAEHSVDLTTDNIKLFEMSLDYKRAAPTGKSSGRVLNRDIEQYGLCSGDRLDPSSTLPDVGDLIAAIGKRIRFLAGSAWCTRAT